MEKEFVPYKLALKLKELGFDELCFGWWSHINGNTASFYSYNCNNTELVDLNTFSKNCTAPLWQQAFNWFSENFSMPNWVYESTGDWRYRIVKGDFWVEDNIKFKSYEEARLACLEKLIEITENEKTNKN